MEQNSTQQVENNTEQQVVDQQQVEETTETVVWYIQTGTIKGISEQEDNVGGLIKGFIELLNKEPWAAIGEIVYGSKKGFDSETPYLLPTYVIAAAIKQTQEFLNKQKEFSQSIPTPVGGIH
jgi:hypothetical protein